MAIPGLGNLSPPERAEAFVLAAGLLILIVGVVELTRRHQWRSALRLPPRDGAGLTTLDAVLVLAPFFWYVFIQSAIAVLLGHSESPATRPDGVVPDTRTAIVQFVGQATTVPVLLMLLALATGGRLSRCGLRLDRIGRDALWAGMGYLACWPLVFFTANLTIWIIQIFQPGFTPQKHSALMLLHDSATPRLVAFLAVAGAAILAPMAEELYFRGILQNVAARATGSSWAGILAAAFVFGGFHSEVQNRPPLILFGIVLGFVYARSRSLLAAIFLHALFNLKTLLFFRWFGY